MQRTSTTQPGCQEVSKATTCPATGLDTAMCCSASPRMEADKGTTPLAIRLGGSTTAAAAGGCHQGFVSFYSTASISSTPCSSDVALTEIFGVGSSEGGEALLVNVVVDLPADYVPAFEGPAADHGSVQVVRGHEAVAKHVVVLLEANSATCRTRGRVRVWADWDNASRQLPDTGDFVLGNL